MTKELFVGQKLRTLNDEFVTVMEIDNDIFIVKYRDVLYRRPISIVGVKLFIDEKEKELIISEEKSCRHCMVFISEECIGAHQICEFYKKAPIISADEKENWPIECDADRFRKRNFRWHK